MPSLHEVRARLSVEGQQAYVQGVEDAAQASGDLADAVERVEGSGGFWEQHSAAINGIGAGMAAGGAALEGFNRSQQDARVGASRVANAIEGETTESILGLASEVHDATRDFDEMIGMMETGRQQGITSGKGLQDYAVFWDTVGDASGESAGSLADASTSLRAIGVAAGEESDALGAFGFMTRESTGSIGEFMRFLDRAGPELRGMGADVDDAAAILGVMEQELGMSSRTARQEFRSAITEADGDLGKMLDTLGVSSDTFETYRGKVADSTDVIQENADSYKESRTPLQELSATLEGTMANYSGLTSAASALSPVMMGAGGAMLAANQAATLLRGSTIATTAASWAATAAKGAWAAATWLLNGAIAVLTSPITLVILAIGLLVAVGIWLWKNWDDVTQWVSGAADWVAEKVGGAFEWIGDLATRVWGGITGTIRDAVNGVIGAVNSMIDAFNRVSITLPIIPDWVPIVGGKGGQTIGLPNIPRIPMLSGGGSGAGRTNPSGRAAYGMNAGGLVPGLRGADEDSVLTYLTPGEWVLNRRAADHLGPELLGVLNRLDGPLEREMGQAGGGGRGPQSWRSLVGMMGASGVAHRVTSTVRNRGGGSYHETGHAVDFAGPTPSSTPNAAMGAIFNYWAQHAGSLRELIYAGAGRNVKNGRWVAPYAVPQHRDHVHVAGLASELAGSAGDDDGGVPFWARPVLNAIARAFGSAFGVDDAEWADGAYVDRPWRGMARVAEHEPEFVTPESQLAAVIDDRLAAHRGGGVTIEHLTIEVDGDVIDPDGWFERNRRPMGRALAGELADLKAHR